LPNRLIVRQLEDYGGDVQAVPISALHGTNVKNLIEAILAQAEVLQLAADPHGPVEGTVIESEIEPGFGKTAVVLIRRGTLKKGDFLVCGHAYAKVRMLLNTGAVLEDEKGTLLGFNRFAVVFIAFLSI
jgi:translation initiation factor IF-2